MSRLNTAVQNLTRTVTDAAGKVQHAAGQVTVGLEHGVEKVAKKTEEVAKRVNRTVNPLSSHFQQTREGAASSRSSHGGGSVVHDPSSRGGLSSTASSDAVDGMSSKEAKKLLERINDELKKEIQMLDKEKIEYEGDLSRDHAYFHSPPSRLNCQLPLKRADVLRTLKEKRDEQLSAYRQEEEEIAKNQSAGATQIML